MAANHGRRGGNGPEGLERTRGIARDKEWQTMTDPKQTAVARRPRWDGGQPSSRMKAALSSGVLPTTAATWRARSP